jgi:hypothetical protein
VVKSFSDAGIDPSGAQGVVALGRIKDALAGKSVRKIPNAGQASGGKGPASAEGVAGPSGTRHLLVATRNKGERASSKEILPKEKLGDKTAAEVFGAVFHVGSAPHGAVPFQMSFNRTLRPLGLKRASHLTGPSVQTYGLKDGRLCVTHYDAEAPVYFELPEVGAALSSEEGPSINLNLDSPSEGEEEA